MLDFSIKKYAEGYRLVRADDKDCWCPVGENNYCASWCPHFVIEKCATSGKCQLVLTCGKYLSRYVEIKE